MPVPDSLELTCGLLLLSRCYVHACKPLSLPPLQRTAAEQALKAFQEHPEAWTRVDAILEKAKAQQTKYYALQVSTDTMGAGLVVQQMCWGEGDIKRMAAPGIPAI